MKKYQPDTQEKFDDALPTPDELADAIIDDLLATVKTNGRIINRRILKDSIINGFAKLELVSVVKDCKQDDCRTTKFSYADELNNFADIVRVGNDDDAEISYAVFIGDPDLKYTFLDLGRFIHEENFTTYRDAQNALALVRRTLELVDENLAMGLKLSDVRDEVLAAVAKKFDVDGDPNDPDFLNLRPAVEHAIKKIFDYYISNGE